FEITVTGMHGDNTALNFLQQRYWIFSSHNSVRRIEIDTEIGRVNLLNNFQEDIRLEGKFRIPPIPILVMIFNINNYSFFFSVSNCFLDHFHTPDYSFFPIQYWS